jgi:hypothetical protein
MKKTLLLTTALVGAVSIIGSANAELKIGAHVKTNYKSFERSATGSASQSGWSQERQIDFSSTGDLNNGWKYAAGFSLEQDAEYLTDDADAALQGSTIDGSENSYVDFIKGNTTLTIGNDHILNGDYGIVPRVGEPMSDEISGFKPNGTNAIAYSQSQGTIKEAMGLGVVQKMDIGTVAVNYAPHAGEKAAAGDTTVGDNTKLSAYEIMFVGGFGVPGLNTAINYSSTQKDDTATQDAELKSFGASYTVGSVKFGAEIAKFELATGAENDTQEIGITFKVNDQISIGAGTTKTDGKDAQGVATTQDEKIKYLQAGYNLGAVGLGLSYIDADSLGNAADNDTKGLVLKMATKF